MKPSTRPPTLSRAPGPPSKRPGVTDSGARFFLRGEYYYRQIGDLAVNLCTATSLSDEQWQEYLDGSLAVARELGHSPNVSVIEFAGGAHPNAGQRRKSAEFIERERVRPIDRVCLLTDNDLLRGAMTAFGWLMPKMKYRPFRPSEAASALAWLLEVAHFDQVTALGAVEEAREKLGVRGVR